jgi:hypothetical protein
MMETCPGSPSARPSIDGYASEQNIDVSGAQSAVDGAEEFELLKGVELVVSSDYLNNSMPV